MGAYDKIKLLCEKNGIAITALEKELGFGRGSLGKLKKGGTSAERLQKIANYFGVSLEYLCDGEKTNQQGGYYINDETAAIAQEIFENRGMRTLFDAARNSKPEDLQMAAELLARLKGTNPDA